jgi:hypothetical protein
MVWGTYPLSSWGKVLSRTQDGEILASPNSHSCLKHLLKGQAWKEAKGFHILALSGAQASEGHMEGLVKCHNGFEQETKPKRKGAQLPTFIHSQDSHLAADAERQW